VAAITSHFPTDHGSHLGAEQFDGGQHIRLGHASEPDLDERAIEPAELVVGHELVDHLLRAADQEPGRGGALCVERLTGQIEALSALVVVVAHAAREVRVHGVARGLARARDVAVHVDARAQGCRVVSRLLGSCAVQLDGLLVQGERPEQQGHGHRQTEASRAHRRGRRTSDRDPDRQFLLHSTGSDVRLVESGSQSARPGDRVLGADREQEVELLAEQLGVVGEVVAEEREGLDVRAATRDDLGPAVRELVECRELLPHPHRVVRAEHRDRARQPDPLGRGGCGGEHDGRSGADEVGAVVLADREEIEAGLVGDACLLDGLSCALLRRRHGARERVLRELDEAHVPQFEAGTAGGGDLGHRCALLLGPRRGVCGSGGYNTVCADNYSR
jgi:hypothetical protein